jgi:arylformamidase
VAKSLHDISRIVDTSTPVWPGDQRFELAWTMSQDQGDAVNVGRVVTTLHLGTHVDAPRHFRAGAPTIGELELAPFLGPAQVVDVSQRDLIRTQDLEPLLVPSTERLLLKTNAWLNDRGFPTEVPVIDRDVPEFLASRKITLLGVDLPSVDRIDSRELPNHHALERFGVSILESLELSAVPAGIYELIALPLRLALADASPVRAILRSI